MTENEIIKALECCSIEHACSKCPYTREKGCVCINEMLKDTLDLINRLQAENDKLKYQVNRLKKYDERQDIDLHSRLITEARAEAIKEYKETLIFNIVNTPIKKTTSAGPFYLSGCADRQNEIIDIIKDLSSKCSKSVTICQQNNCKECQYYKEHQEYECLPYDIGDTAYCVNGYGSNRYIEKFTVDKIVISNEGIVLIDPNEAEWLARVCHFSLESAEKELNSEDNA